MHFIHDGSTPNLDVNFKKFTQFIKVKVIPRGQMKVQYIKTLKVSDSGHLCLCCGIKNWTFQIKIWMGKRGGGELHIPDW